MELSPKARHLLVSEIKDQGESISDVSKKYGVSRVTVYKWLEREKLGSDLVDQKRHIDRYWHQAPEKYEGAVLSLVSNHPEWGIRTLVKNLPKIADKPILGHHGVQNVLRRNNLSTYELRLAHANAQITPITNVIGLAIAQLRKSIKLVPFGISTLLTAFITIVVLGASSSGSFTPPLIFAWIALFAGSIFFAYSLKYYLTLAIVLSYSQKPEDGSKKNILEGLLFGFKNKNSAINNSIGLKSDLEDVRLTHHPFISVHIPFFNEKNVVERAIRASTGFKYAGEYEVILCDDSTDETSEIIRQYQKDCLFKGESLKVIKGDGWTLTSVEIKQGVTLKHLKRTSREGFKGAALGLAQKMMDKRAEFVAVFDADFVPYPDSLDLFLKYFQQSENTKVAAVQGYQWHVLNKSENWITRGVRSEYSGSYVVERSGAEIYGGLKQISGSVYMIKRNILEEVGWGTSITEDFELTLKLYEKGYKVLYTPYIQAPAECVSTLKRLIRQRMRWAEGHSFNIKKMFMKLMTSPNLTVPEKLETVYLAPYYLQAFFFLVGTLSWLISETIFKVKLPFWTEVWGWSLILTNMVALPLVNGVGLFLEESEERDFMGLGSFIALSYIVVPFQAYAAVKGFLEKEEGPWFRTPKTGRITDIFARSGLARFIAGVLPVKQLNSQTVSSYLAINTANSRFNNFQIKPKNSKWIGNLALSLVLVINSILVYLSPFTVSNKNEILAKENKVLIGSNTNITGSHDIESQTMYKMADIDVIFHNDQRVRYKKGESEIEFKNLTRASDAIYEGQLVTYKNVAKDTDLLYRIWDYRVNESYLMKSYQPISSFSTSINLTNTVITKNSEGGFYVASSSGEDVLLTIEAPYMYEENNSDKKSFELKYDLIKKSDGSYVLEKIITDEGKKWLSDPSRKFPVVIDPTVYRSNINGRANYANTEGQFGSNQRKIAYMPNATGGASWYMFLAEGNIIRYKKCIASTSCDDDADWSAFTSVDANGDAGDYDPNIAVEGDSIYIAWIDDTTVGGAAAVDSLEFRALNTTNDTFGTQCTTASQGTLDNSNFPYIAVGDNGDVVVGYSDTAGDAEADIFEVATGGCTFTSIEASSGLPTGTTTMRPVAVGLGNKIHVVYDDASNEIRHSIRDVSTGAWDSVDTVADNGNVLNDIFSVTTDGSSLWLLYTQDSSTTVLQKCASTCTTTWSNLTSPFTSMTTIDYPNLSYYSSDTDLRACINSGSSSTTQDVLCKTSDSGTISWGGNETYSFNNSDYTELSTVASVTTASLFGGVIRDNTDSVFYFLTSSNKVGIGLQTIVAAEAQFGSNQRKIAYMPNATGGASWYAFHADANIIKYKKCVASSNCDEDGDWGADTNVDTNGDAGDYNPTVWVEGDTLWIGWVDDATAGGANAIDSVEIRSLNTTNDTFGTQCTSADQGTLDSTNYVYLASGDNGDVVVGYSDTAGDAEADVWEIATGGCTFTSIEASSGLPTGTTTMRPVAVGLGNKIHVVYDDAANEIRHSIRDVSTGAWDSVDTVADNGNVLNDIFSVTTDGSALWLLYMVDATNAVLQKCASTCTTTWSNLTTPFSSTDLTSADYPNLIYDSGASDITACINNGSSTTTQNVVCKNSDATTISWGSTDTISAGTSNFVELSSTMSVADGSQIALYYHDTTRSNLKFATVPENFWLLILSLPLFISYVKSKKHLI